MSEARVLGTARPGGRARRRPRGAAGWSGCCAILLPLLALVPGRRWCWLWPQHHGRSPAASTVPTFVPGEVDQPDMLRMDSPRYVGQTRSERPYELTAASASLDPKKANIVHLDQPPPTSRSATMATSASWPRTGTYDRDTERLAAGWRHRGDHQQRLSLRDAERARINLAQGQVRGWQPIEGAGPAGTLSADRFEIQDAGNCCASKAASRSPPAAGARRDAGRRACGATRGGTSS